MVAVGREPDDLDVWQHGGVLSLYGSSSARLSGCTVTGNEAEMVSAHVDKANRTFWNLYSRCL